MSTIHVAMAPARAEPADAVLIVDRWRWGAFLFPLLWALWGRHWLAALALALAAAGLGWAAEAGALVPAAAAELGLRLAVGWEGGALARADRRVRGWVELGAVEAADDDAAEIAWAERVAAAGPGPWGAAWAR